MKQILRCLTGSRAHGLASETSDYDYRSVFLVPTREFFSLSGEPRKTSWVEGEGEDDTAWELNHFLKLAIHSDPNILEVFTAPLIEATPEGEKLRELFPHVWSSEKVFTSFSNYAKNQQRKMLDDKYESRERKWKFAVTYLRVLIQGQYLLKTGQLITEIPPQWRALLMEIKAGRFSQGFVIDQVDMVKTEFLSAYERNPDKKTNLEPIMEYLLSIRKENW